MRLLNAYTLELEVFADPIQEAIPYAILSHTWANDEVTFEDMKTQSARQRTGFAKILAACEKTKEYGLTYIWIDTCCIDKSSSAELSECINSMFRWYKNSTVCIAFLADLSSEENRLEVSVLRKCRWWSRGWTLQELIAPTFLIFVDESWNLVETKADLADSIELITGINRGVLEGHQSLSTVSLAKRMSWAAARETTRVEDKAYCLLGIFEVNIPMIYGEGSKAFIRLQEEIISRTTDLSIFGWKVQEDVSSSARGVLADSPAEFAHCGSIERCEDQFRFRDEINLTNRGVKIQTSLIFAKNGIYLMDLHCYNDTLLPGPVERLAIYLKRAQDTYYRYLPHLTTSGGMAPSTKAPRPIYLALSAGEEVAAPSSIHNDGRNIFFHFPLTESEYKLHDVRAVPEMYWDVHDRYFSIGTLENFIGFVRFSVTSSVAIEEVGGTSEKTSSFIAVCDLSGKDLRVCLYAESGLKRSRKPADFINPFTNINQYGPLGDAFSLTLLRPDEAWLQSVTITHRDHRHNYTVSAKVSSSLAPSFLVTVDIQPQTAE